MSGKTFDKVMDDRKRIVEKIIENMEKGYILQPNRWNHAAFLPHNPVSGCFYRGGNRFRLMLAAEENGYTDPRWMTFKQAQEKGYKVKKGAHSVLCEKWIFTKMEPVLDESGNPMRDANQQIVKQEVELQHPTVSYFLVFNAEQIDGIPELTPQKDIEPNEIGDMFLAASECPIYLENTDSAYYSPAEDAIHLPQKSFFRDSMAFYATAIHEMSHSTGHESRLNRDIRNKFGTPAYALEELRAELSTLFIEGDLQLPISNMIYQDHSNYLLSWIGALKDDPNELFRAIADCDKISERLISNYEKHHQIHITVSGLSEREQRSIIFEYETIKKTPDRNRLTKWYGQAQIAVQKAYIESNKTPISQQHIQDKCISILKEIDRETLHSLYESYIINEIMNETAITRKLAEYEISPNDTLIQRIQQLCQIEIMDIQQTLPLLCDIYKEKIVSPFTEQANLLIQDIGQLIEQQQLIKREHNLVTIEEYACYKIDEWTSGNNSYVLGRGVYDENYYVILANANADMSYSYTELPTHSQAETDLYNLEFSLCELEV